MDSFKGVETRITVVVFLAMLLVLSIVNLVTPAREFSENENRYLQQMPVFSGEALVNGKFTADFDTFIVDQFAFRDGWVGMKALMEKAIGRGSSNGVYFAADDYLIEMFDSVDADRYGKNLVFAGDFSRRVQSELGVPVHTMLVPTSSMILADKLPRNAPEVDQRALLLQAADEIPGFIDVSAALGRHSGESIFYRTDHHWTSLGAYYAYTDWREQTGRTAPNLEQFSQSVLSENFYGTTWSKASLYTTPADAIMAFEPKETGSLTVDYNNGETVTDTIYERSFLEVKDKYSVFLNANQPIVWIHTGVQNGEKLLIVKDSFANSFVQMLLTDYEEIAVVDLRYFKLSAYDFIRENGVTEVLVQYNLKGFSSDANLYYLST